MDSGAAPSQFAQKPTPFVLELSIGDENALSGPEAAEFGFIERVAARTSFDVDKREVTVDRVARRITRPKPHQLRVQAITLSAPTKHLAGK